MFRKLADLLSSQKRLYITAITATFLAAIFSLLTPLVIQFIIDYVLTDTPTESNNFYTMLFSNVGSVSYFRENIWVCSFVVILIQIIGGGLAFVRNRLTAIGAENIAKNLKDKLYNHLQNLPYAYHVKAQTGDLIQRCTSDVDTVRRFLAMQLIEMFRIIFIAAIAGIILLNYSVKLTLVSILIVPAIFFASYYFLKVIRKSFLKADAKEGELSTVIQENLTGIRVVKAFGREAFELDKFKTVNNDYTNLAYKSLYYLAVYWGISDFLCFSQLAAVVAVGAYMGYRGEITIGTLLVFTIYVNSLVWPLRQLGRILSNMGKMEVSLTRINEVMAVKEEDETPGAINSGLKGDIVFENVSFEYEKNKPVLENVSFHVKAGEKIAVLGSTGSGKSSLMHLFLRLYDYKSGSIKINGYELRNIKKKHLRQRIGIVLQEPFLFSKTIRENIKMAMDVVEDEQVYEAANMANVHNVIESFNEGYETIIGERGVTLSGGQKQRVAIARTLVKDSDILIFDDSLSAVDAQTDMMIQAELAKKSEGITTFIISQRITTLRNADRILILENGRLTDSGTHEELIGRDGLYFRVWNIQNIVEDEFDEEA